MNAVRFTYHGSVYEELVARSGQTVTAVPLDETQYDRAEVGPMFHITFADGYEQDAFADELVEVAQ